MVFRLLVILTVAFALVGCDDKTVVQDKRDVTAVYIGPGVWAESATALRQAILFNQWNVDTIGVKRLLDGELMRYGAIAVPGGDPYIMSSALGPIGRQAIRDFVYTGGGYFGVGGGAVIADTNADAWRGIGLFIGNAPWPVAKIAPYPETVMTMIDLNYRLHPIGTGGADHYVTLYRYGPEFMTGASVPMDIIYKYDLSNTPALIAVGAGNGVVVLAGFQPEFEENSNRDSVNVGSNLNDPDSEWDIINRVINLILPIN